jgi:hypothetical protein
MIEEEYLSRMERIDAPELKKGAIYYDPLVETLVFLFFTGWDINEGIDSFKVTSRVIARGKKVRHTVVEMARPTFSFPLIFNFITIAMEKEEQGKLLPITIVGMSHLLRHVVRAAQGVLFTLEVNFVNSYQEYIEYLASLEATDSTVKQS